MAAARGLLFEGYFSSPRFNVTYACPKRTRSLLGPRRIVLRRRQIYRQIKRRRIVPQVRRHAQPSHLRLKDVARYGRVLLLRDKRGAPGMLDAAIKVGRCWKPRGPDGAVLLRNGR